MELKNIFRFIIGLGVSLATVAGCQKTDQPTTVPTQQQWEQIKGHLLEKQPTPDYEIGANYGDRVELIGFDVETPLIQGEKTTFTWYWKALTDMDKNWKIFIHLDHVGKRHRQNLDHHPLDGLYQTSRWKKGQIIEDVQEVRIQPDYPPGMAMPRIGLYKGGGVHNRMKIKNDVPKESDRRVKGPKLPIKTKDGKGGAFEPTIYKAMKRTGAPIDVDGNLDESAWQQAPSLELSPIGHDANKPSSVKLVYDSDALYIGSEFEDEHVWSNKTERDSHTWQEEVFEVFLDLERDGKNYMELQINPRGTVFDANFEKPLGTAGDRGKQIEKASNWNLEGLQKAVSVQGSLNDKKQTDKAWRTELRIPFSEIPGAAGEPSSDKDWAINFYRYDRPDSETVHTFGWSTRVGGNFHRTKYFGRLEFASDEVGDESSSSTGKESNDKGANVKPTPKLKGKQKVDPDLDPSMKKVNVKKLRNKGREKANSKKGN